jgi:hypothetical protein
MDEPQFWIRFVLAVLATWRVSHLLASEDGPGNIIAHMRVRLGNSVFRRLADCFGCLSMWIAIPFSFFVCIRPIELVMTWLALSGAAFLLERLAPEPVIIERIPDTTTGEG